METTLCDFGLEFKNYTCFKHYTIPTVEECIKRMEEHSPKILSDRELDSTYPTREMLNRRITI